MSEHTPGPWEHHETGAIVGPKIDDKPVWLRPVIARFETGVKDADAKLIAAAPDLLEALQRIRETGVFVGAIAQEMMDKAIEKAKGEQE